MPISLQALCKYAQDSYKMRLVSGEMNTSNIVKWIHIVEDPAVAKFLNGYELIFTTGIASKNESWLLDYVKDLHQQHTAGLVINVGPYIRQVPKDVLTYCQKHHFPVFTLPWEVRLVDITYDFCHQIIRSENNDVTVASAFKNAIFCPSEEKTYTKALERREFDLNSNFCVAVLSADSENGRFRIEQEKYLRLKLQAMLNDHTEHFSIFHQGAWLVIVVQNMTGEQLNSNLAEIADTCCQEYKTLSFFAGVGPAEQGIGSLPGCYKKALAALKMAEKGRKSSMYYGDMGIYRLLADVEDTKILQYLYKEKLGKLIDYDVQNGTDYAITLRCYLENDASIQRVSQKTYVHRNTINYKIRKVKQILDTNLDYEESLNLLFAFYVQDFL